MNYLRTCQAVRSSCVCRLGKSHLQSPSGSEVGKEEEEGVEKTEDNVQLGKKMIFVPFYVGKTKLWTVMLHRNLPCLWKREPEEFGKVSAFSEMRMQGKKGQ